jgi:hypothetical protein
MTHHDGIDGIYQLENLLNPAHIRQPSSNLKMLIKETSRNYIIYPLIYSFSCLLTPRHNFDVRKESDQSNHTTVGLFSESWGLIGHRLF